MKIKIVLAVLAVMFWTIAYKVLAVSISVKSETVEKTVVENESKCWSLAAGDSFDASGTISGTKSSFAFTVPAKASVRVCVTASAL